MLERIAHAKINLALHVMGNRDDGYHLLDSLVFFTEFGDKIAITKNEKALSLVWLKIDGEFSEGLDDGANNLVNRAALALAYKIMEKGNKPEPVKITLTKNLPIASGIGGGSADAAATLLALKEFWGANVSLDDIALELGADVPMCLHSKSLRAKGIGDEITELAFEKPLHVVLVNPKVEVPTPEIFKKLKNKNNSPIKDDDIIAMNLKDMRNDLQQPAIEIAPEISAIMNVLEETKCLLARMSGSGATCFGIYETSKQAQMAANKISDKHPNWWCVATSTTVS